MQPFLIFLVILGLAIIFISYFLSERYASNQDQKSDIWNLHELTDEGREFMLQNVGKRIKERADEIIIKADDELSQISNEKIIAVSEYSDQILDKIKHNHEEVVFMYHMLTEKENELKSLIKDLNEVKGTLKNGTVDLNTLNKYSEKTIDIQGKESVLKDKNDNAAKEVLTHLIPTTQVDNTANRLGNPSKTNRRKKRNSKSAKNNQVTNTQRQYNSKEIDPLFMEEAHMQEDSEQNNNDRILRLYKEGKSVVEIAKFLELGQGEVKLVIDLFREKNV